MDTLTSTASTGKNSDSTLSKRTIIGIASGLALIVAGLTPATGSAAAATAAVTKCPVYTQLTGGGGAYYFTAIRASNLSCKTALTLLEVFANNPTQKTIEGFACTRGRAGKADTASCVHHGATVAFLYTPPPKLPPLGKLLHHRD